MCFAAALPARFDFQDHKQPWDKAERAEMHDVAVNIIKTFEYFQAKHAQQEAKYCNLESSPVREAEEGRRQRFASRRAALQEEAEGQRLAEEEALSPEVTIVVK